MFDKIIFPEKCRNNFLISGGNPSGTLPEAKPVDSILNEETLEVQKQEETSTHDQVVQPNLPGNKKLKGGRRPHFYHVICYDLMVDSLRQQNME